MRFAIVGTGYVSADYARTLTGAGGRLVAAFDTHIGRRDAFVHQWGAPAVGKLEEVAELGIDAAVNLTSPLQHAEVSRALLAVGVPVYSEKPLAHELTAGLELARLSDHVGVPLACAPDTVLGGLQQQLRRAVDTGMIGRPLFVSGQIAWPGHERWHPRPELFYQAGGGPLFDLGPYWITAMVNLIGPAVAVTALRSRLTIRRMRRTDAGALVEIVPEVPTTVSLLIEFASGVTGALTLSFDLPFTAAPSFEVVGDEGAIVADTPMFDDFGVLRHRTLAASEFSALPPPAPDTGWRRGMGVLDMVRSRADGLVPRLDKSLALHVLDIIEAAEQSATTGRQVTLSTTCPRPVPYAPEAG